MTSSRRAITASPSSATIPITQAPKGPQQLTIPLIPVKVRQTCRLKQPDNLEGLTQAISAYENFCVEAVLLGGYPCFVDFSAVAQGGLSGRLL